MSVSATFEDRLGNVNKGKLVLDLTNDIVGPETVKIYYGVTGPSSVLKAFDIGTPDFTSVAPAAVNTVTVDLPVLGTLYEQGDYTVHVRFTRQSDDALLDDLEQTYTYSPFDDCGDVVTTAFSETVYCSAKALVIKDETIYSPYTPTRVITVVHPTIPGVATPADTVSALTLINIPIEYMNVSYTTNYDIEFTLSTVVGNITFDEQHSVNSQAVTLIDCVDICDIQECLEDELTSLEAKAQSSGGVHNMPTDKQDKLALINTYYNSYLVAERCSDTASMKNYYAKLKTLVDCSGNCCDDGKIKAIPAYGELSYIHGTDGADGLTILNGGINPTTEGVDGDFYINTATTAIFGPKTGGLWGAGTLLIGAAGADGSSVLNGSGVPSGGLGKDGDFYIDSSTFEIYGPKSGGVWGAATSLIGGGSVTPWVEIDASDFQFPWTSFPSTSSAVVWRRNGGHLEVRGKLFYDSTDPGALATVPFLDKTWLPVGVSVPDEWIYGAIYSETLHEPVGVIKEADPSDTLIYFSRNASFAVATNYRISLIIPIEE